MGDVKSKDKMNDHIHIARAPLAACLPYISNPVAFYGVLHPGALEPNIQRNTSNFAVAWSGWCGAKVAKEVCYPF
jgi:hypothetical protein